MTDRWHIALTQLNKDGKAADALAPHYEVYRPTLPMKVRLRGRMVRDAVKSMFPGYVFVRDRNFTGWGPLRRAQGVRIGSCLLVVNGQLATVDNRAVDLVREIEQDEVIKTRQKALPYNIGAIVQVIEGPFEHLMGKVAALDDKGSVCVLMNMLGHGTPVWFKPSDLNVA